MLERIGPKHPTRHFLREWREKKGLTQEQLGQRVNSGKDQISRWEKGGRSLKLETQYALAHALGIEPGDLFHHPDQPSADALLRQADPATRKQVIDYINFLLKKAG